MSEDSILIVNVEQLRSRRKRPPKTHFWGLFFMYESFGEKKNGWCITILDKERQPKTNCEQFLILHNIFQFMSHCPLKFIYICSGVAK